MPGPGDRFRVDRVIDLRGMRTERTASGRACADWLIRAEHDRCLADGRKLRQGVENAPALAEVEFDLPATAQRKARRVRQALRAARVALKPPHRSDRTLPTLAVTVVLAREIDPPEGEAPVEWLLLTSVPVNTAEQALEKLRW